MFQISVNKIKTRGLCLFGHSPKRVRRLYRHKTLSKSIGYVLTDCCGTFITGSDTDTTRQIQNKDLAIADFTRARTFDNGFDRPINEILVNRDVQTDFAQEVSRLFRAAVKFIHALLAPMAQNFTDGDEI